ncbi:MAG: Maf family protein [Roseovarius sp.]
MPQTLILASASPIRQTLLRQAGVPFAVSPPRLDEHAIRASLQADGASPRDIADALAEAKARRAAQRLEDTPPVLGVDQILAHRGAILGKPETAAQARAQLAGLRGATHRLITAAVIWQGDRPVWRHVGEVRLRMHDFSDSYLDAYLARNWPGIRDAVGGYKLEEEGVRLFSRIEGDYFCVLGLPLLEVLAWLRQNGVIET